MATVDDPVTALQLVAEPLRWRILAELADSDRRVGELCARTGQPQNLVSYHVARLRDAGLVSVRRSTADGRDRYYRAELTRCGEVLAAAGAALHPGLRLHVDPCRAPAVRGAPATRVLFLCTGNSARSQIAAALAEHRSGGAVEARSAGSHPKALHPLAVRVLAERGIDIAGRSTTHLDTVRRLRFDHVITLCDKVREVCPELPGRPSTAHWSVPDPASGNAGYAAFVHAADEIDERVRFFLARLAAPDRSPRAARSPDQLRPTPRRPRAQR